MKHQLEEYYAWLQIEEELEMNRQHEESLYLPILLFDAAYEEAQSMLRLSCTCKNFVRDLSYPLTNRIVEMASFISQVGNCS